MLRINRDLVNHGIAASLTEDRKDLLRLVGADVVFSQNPLDVCNAGFNDILVIGTAILSKKKLKDINGDICPFLDLRSLRTILPSNTLRSLLSITAFASSVDTVSILAHFCFSSQVKSEVIRKGNVNMELSLFRDICIIGNNKAINLILVIGTGFR